MLFCENKITATFGSFIICKCLYDLTVLISVLIEVNVFIEPEYINLVAN